MTAYSKYNFVYRLQKWMDSVPGQTFLNYGYSWGASVVILGALFKLTHLPGANLMLYLGMGTEVIVFFLSAFDRPFDKTADGLELPSHVTEEYLTGVEAVAHAVQRGTSAMSTTGQNAIKTDAVATSSIPLQQADAKPSEGILSSSPSSDVEVAEATSRYIDELNRLTETLEKVSEQSARLTRDSEEMENLNRTLTGITKVYEMQLKGASQQIGTIDQINDQSRRMAQQIEQLNAIYARMIEAMTVNMKMQNP